MHQGRAVQENVAGVVGLLPAHGAERSRAARVVALRAPASSEGHQPMPDLVPPLGGVCSVLSVRLVAGGRPPRPICRRRRWRAAGARPISVGTIRLATPGWYGRAPLWPPLGARSGRRVGRTVCVALVERAGFLGVGVGSLVVKLFVSFCFPSVVKYRFWGNPMVHGDVVFLIPCRSRIYWVYGNNARPPLCGLYITSRVV